MSRLLRTRPCPCGSGRAARDCCGRFRRLPEAEVARAYLHRQARTAREVLAPFSPGGLAGLRSELVGLPSAHPVMEQAWRGPTTLAVERLIAAAQKRAGDAEAFVHAMLARLDTPLMRVALARATIALRQEGAIDEHLAAAALVDLDQAGSVLLEAAVLARVHAELAPAG